MRAVVIENLKPGSIMGTTLVDEGGMVLLRKGVKLSQTYIDSLRDKGYTQLYVREEEDPEIDFEEDLSPVVRARAIECLRNAYEKIQSELHTLRRASEQDIRKACQAPEVRGIMGEKGPIGELLSMAESIVNDVMSASFLAGLTSLKNRNARLYDHSLDVTVLSIVVGRSLGMNHKRLCQLAGGCLLHDIGMLFVRPNLAEPKRIRQHTTLGFELLRETETADLLAAHVAYEHHEHQDGTGLPRGLTGSNKLARSRSSGPVPTLIGEVCAVTNLYDNLLSGTPQRKPVSPDKAMAVLLAMAGKRLNSEVVTTFRRLVAIYPIGTQVQLFGGPTDRFIGVVAEVDPAQLDRPVVLLARDGQGRRVQKKIKVDLRRHPEIKLRSMLGA
jgi:putative nucleotidyltransferase with HDIG domain